MAETKLTIFELKVELENFRCIAYDHIQDIFDFYKYATNELCDLVIKLNKKSVTYSGNHPLIREGLEMMLKSNHKFSEQERKIAEGIELVDYYSKYNIFVWLKRYHKLYEESHNKFYYKKEYSRRLLSWLKELNDNLQPFIHTKFVVEMLPFLEGVREDLLKSTTLKLEMYDCYPLIANIFTFEPTMKKNDFLNLVQVRKHKDTMRVINSLPEDITIEDFRNAIFVERIEDDLNYYLHDIMIEHVFKVRDANPTAAKEMDEKLGLDMIPTYNVSFDEYGEVSAIKQNPPNLQLV